MLQHGKQYKTTPKLIITVDTEPDNQWSRMRNSSVTLDNIPFTSRFQKLCEFYGIKPTYLVTSSVAKSDVCVHCLKQYMNSGNAEIGAHLHPWETKPYYFGENTAVSHAFPNEFSYDELFGKIKNLTREIETSFGVRPKSYRAGRFGICLNQIRILEQLGYLVDCSITPNISWASASGFRRGSSGPVFDNVVEYPYFIGRDNLLLPGDNGLLEMPVTILYTVKYENYIKLFGKLDRFCIDKFGFTLKHSVLCNLKPFWFRPLPKYTIDDLKKVAVSALQKQLPYVEMIIHSSEFMPGCSPYWPDNDAIDFLFHTLDSLFRWVRKEMQFESMTLREFHTYFTRRISG